MTGLRVLFVRLGAMLGFGRRDEDVADEMQLHLELLAEDHRQRGLSVEDARLAARKAFGGVLPAREAYRAQQRIPSLDAWMQDVRFATRRLLHDRSSTLAAIGLLTLGVTATVIMGDMLDRLLLRAPAGIDAPERVRRVYDQPGTGRPSALITNYVTIEHLWSGLPDEVESMAAYQTERLGLGRGADARRVVAVTHSDGYFDVLGLRPAIGVLPTARDADSRDTVVISYGFWQRYFGGDTNVLGRTLQLGKRLYTIVAVGPRGFAGIDADPVDVWLPIESRAADGALQEDWRTGTGYYALSVIARLRAEVDRSRAEVHASAVYNARPSTWPSDVKRPHVKLLFGELPPARIPGGTGEVRTIQWIAVVSGLVLLISCGNVGNLLLVRGLRRGAELALKASLGATRGRLIRELLIEAGLLSLAAGIVALLVVMTSGTLIERLVLPPVLAATEPLDGRLIVLAVGVCLTTAALVGAVPALRLTSGHMLNPVRSMQLGANPRLLDAFVALQVALSLPLIVGASLFSLSLWHARQVNFGLDTTNVVVVSMNPDELGTPAETHAAHRRIQDRLRRLPQVQSAALVETVPMVMGVAYVFSIPGRPSPSGMLPFANGVDPSYFRVMGLRFVSGRPFTPAENVARGRAVAVINQAMARKYWPDESPLGSCIHVGAPEKPCADVIGIVADAATWPSSDFTVNAQPMYYLPIEQYGDLHKGRAVLVRTSHPPAAALSLIRAEAQRTANGLPYVDVWAFDDLFQPALKPLRMGALVFVAFGVLALVIAGVGLAAVTAYGVQRRTREIGIRLVLGADPRELVRLILGRSLGAVGLGLTAGCLLAYAGSRWLRSVLYGVETDDLRVYVTTTLLLLSVGIVAAYLPARRAGRIEPAEALRTE